MLIRDTSERPCSSLVLRTAVLAQALAARGRRRRRAGVRCTAARILFVWPADRTLRTRGTASIAQARAARGGRTPRIGTRCIAARFATVPRAICACTIALRAAGLAQEPAAGGGRILRRSVPTDRRPFRATRISIAAVVQARQAATQAPSTRGRVWLVLKLASNTLRAHTLTCRASSPARIMLSGPQLLNTTLVAAAILQARRATLPAACACGHRLVARKRGPGALCANAWACSDRAGRHALPLCHLRLLSSICAVALVVQTRRAPPSAARGCRHGQRVILRP